MPAYTLREIFDIARNGTEDQWLRVVDFVTNYKGEEDDLLGLQHYLEEHNYNKMLLLSLHSEIEKMDFRKRRMMRKRIPAWAMVMAACIVLAGGLYINNSVQRKSLHVLEVPLPVYLSDADQLFNKAMSLYKKADYEKASLAFRQLSSDTAVYYSGVCYEMLSYFELSKSAFERIEPVSPYYNKAQIRLAAIAVGEGNTSVARNLVNGIRPADRDEVERIRSVKARLK